jgi:hypothetical protein
MDLKETRYEDVNWDPMVYITGPWLYCELGSHGVHYGPVTVLWTGIPWCTLRARDCTVNWDPMVYITGPWLYCQLGSHGVHYGPVTLLWTPWDLKFSQQRLSAVRSSGMWDWYERFGVICCLHLQGGKNEMETAGSLKMWHLFTKLHDVTSWMTVILMKVMDPLGFIN